MPFRPHRASFRMADFAGNPPQWALDERARQAEFIAQLRASYRLAAEVSLRLFIGKRLTGPGPWLFAAEYAAWREHCGRLKDWNSAYKSRWFSRALTGSGFAIEGRRRTLHARHPIMVEAKMADGSLGSVPLRKDGRIVYQDAQAQAIDERRIVRKESTSGIV